MVIVAWWAAGSTHIIGLYVDSNKDGKLSKAELLERMQTVIARYDADKNGAFDKAEFDKLAAARAAGGPGGGLGGGLGGGGPGGSDRPQRPARPE